LRDRIRRRLVDAAHIAVNRRAAEAGNAEHDFICAVLDRAVAEADTVARQLRTAAAAIDEATIVTIHGFAQRATQDNAFDSALAFDRGDNVDDKTVFAEAAADYWRSAIYGDDAEPELLELWPTPEALGNAINPILERPGVIVDGTDAGALQQALTALQAHWDDDRARLLAALDNAADHDAFKNSGLKSLLAMQGTPA